MQLRNARLCLDCEELHDAPQCPICASEAFVYISRWVPTPERRTGPRTSESTDAAALQRLLESESGRPKSFVMLKRGVIGLAALSLARWIWRQGSDPTNDPRPRGRDR